MHAVPTAAVGSRPPRARARWVTLVAAGVLVLATAKSGWAQLPATRLYALFPAGGRAGTTFEVTVASGADLEGVDRLWFSHPGLTAQQKMQTVEGQPAPTAVANVFVVTIAADVPVGLHDVRAAGSYGVSNPRAFQVGDTVEVLETEPNAAAAQAGALAPGEVVNGRADAALDIDWFRCPLTQGQRVVFEAWAERIDSRCDATLELYDARGRLVAGSRDVLRKDPLLDFTAPETGDYFVKLFDFQYAGGAEYFYRLAAHTRPVIDFVLPAAAGSEGTTTAIAYGHNVPLGSPTDGQVSQGQLLEQFSVALALPSEVPAGSQWPWQSAVRPSAAWMDGFSYLLATPWGASQPLAIGRSVSPAAVAEHEPNDDQAMAEALALPCDVSGQFARRGDVDWYTFQAEKGMNLVVEVFSGRLDTAANPYLVVEQLSRAEDGTESSKTLAEAGIDPGGNIGPPGFDTSTDDPTVQFTVPETGTYRVMLRDLFGESRGDPRRVYRLCIAPAVPDLRLVACAEYPLDPAANSQAWTTNLRQGGTEKLLILAFRRGGLGGEIEVSATNLPEGVTCGRTVIGAGRNSGHLVLSAAEAAPLAVASIELAAQARLGDTVVARAVRAGTTVWPGVAATPSPARLARGTAISVAGVAPYTLAPQVMEAVVYQSQELAVPLSITRRGDFAGALSVTGADLADKVVNETLTIAADQSQGVLRLFVPQDAPPGIATWFAQSTTQVPFTKKPDGSDKQNINVLDFWPGFTVTIQPGPLVLAPQPPNNGNLARGKTLEVPVAITRRGEFAGPVVLGLIVPPGVAGISAAEVTIAADQAQGVLSVAAAADATEGALAHVLVGARVEWQAQTIELSQPLALVVTP